MDSDDLDAILHVIARSRHRRFPRLNRATIQAAVGQLGQGDQRRTRLVGDLLLHQGRRSMPALLEAAQNAALPIRRSAVYLVGRQAARLPDGPQRQAAATCLLKALGDDDAKVRKNATVVLGPWIPAATEVLIDALSHETVAWIRPSLLLALGAVGGPRARAALEAWTTTDAAEIEALNKALDRTAPALSNRTVRRPFDSPIIVELWTRPGLESLLKSEVQERLKQLARPLSPGRLSLETDDLHQLYSLRTLAQVMLPLLSGPRAVDLIPSLVQQACQAGVFDRLLAWHTPAQEPLTYRMEVRGPGLAHGRQRSLVKNLVPALAAATPHLVNSPSRYQVELRLVLHADSFQLLGRLCTLPDERFTYRQADVAAALDPVVAAGLVRALPKVEPGARVLDPFCGSGTLLIERGLLAPYNQLVGIDIAPQAVRAASGNIAAVGLQRATIQQGNAAALDLAGPFDELIANLPFGIRSGDHTSNQALYAAFFGQMPNLLAPGARMVLYTQEQKLTHRLFKRCKALRLEDSLRIEAGGLQPTAFIATRR